MAERISDDALVIRGGRNRPVDLERGTGTHPSGTTGVSVECASGLTVEELAASIPHSQIGVTTVVAVRTMGGDVVRTSGRTPNHATLTGLSPEEMSALLTPTVRKPARGD
jgi:hypothetical protein